MGPYGFMPIGAHLEVMIFEFSEINPLYLELPPARKILYFGIISLAEYLYKVPRYKTYSKYQAKYGMAFFTVVVRIGNSTPQQ